jgi:hypothetical protein
MREGGDELSDDKRDTGKSWEKPDLKHVGDVSQVLQQGGAKLSQDNPEPGELSTKPPGH